MPRQALTIASRVIRQIGRDHRTAALILIVPLVVMTLIGLSFPQDNILNFVAPALLATLALFFGFLLTGISFLRERSQGTMERLMVSPVSILDILIGYLSGFLIFAMVQTIIILLFTIYVLDVRYSGDLWQIFVLQAVIAMGAVNLGIFISTFARNEFQVAQFIPLVIVPQMFLCGVIWPVEQMSVLLQWIAKILPLTYGVDGLHEIMVNGKSLLDVRIDLLVLVGFVILTSILAAITLSRGQVA